tara:strand:+ start:485 stop:889 length:405 start_codon:yes stop_codon:yes gene_type:complete
VTNLLLWAAVKENFKQACKFIKKYWQFFLGLSVGLLILVLKRDTSEMKKTFQKFKETSDQMRDESLEISKETSEKSLDAVETFKESLESAENERENREKEIDEKSAHIKQELLESEKNNPGSLARELQEEIDKI